jgi:glucuronate isomerase
LQARFQVRINKLPSKSLRYIIGATIGAIEPLTGHTVSVADSFLLEKVLGGWRPSHFVERTLKPFIENEEG